MPNGTHIYNSNGFYIPESQEEQHLEQLRFQFKTLLWKLRQAQTAKGFQATLAKLPEDFKLGEPSPATREIPFSFYGLSGQLNPDREYHYYLSPELWFYSEGQDLPVASLIGISRMDDLWAVAQIKYNPAGLEDPDTLED
jgi:hypothetical protein